MGVQFLFGFGHHYYCKLGAPSSQTWTVPPGGGIGRVYKIGKQAVNNRVEFYYNVEKPDSAPDWSWSFTFEFLLPK
jgi:hypothetical protein